jgi:putative tryptophan/tyrosine transport system substrate-binding protein
VKKREFIAGLGSAAVWPAVARAQQAGRLPIVGFLGANPSGWEPWKAAFAQRLRDLGWIENRTVAIEYRWSEGSHEREAEIAAEFVRLKVDVVVCNSNAVPALRHATSTIPIVFVLAQNPVAAGLVTSLARPESNVTGLAAVSADLASKKLELLREVAPHLRRLAVMVDGGVPEQTVEGREVQTAAGAFGIEVLVLDSTVRLT